MCCTCLRCSCSWSAKRDGCSLDIVMSPAWKNWPNLGPSKSLLGRSLYSSRERPFTIFAVAEKLFHEVHNKLEIMILWKGEGFGFLGRLYIYNGYKTCTMELPLEFLFPLGNVKKPSVVRPTESGPFLQGTCLQGEFHHVHIIFPSPLF